MLIDRLREMDEPRTERYHGLGSLILCALCVWNTLKSFLTGHLSNEQVNEQRRQLSSEASS
jgi:hypothetical protein